MSDKKLCFSALVLLLVAGCARTPDRSEEYFADPPTPEDQVKQTLSASEKGPSSWSPAVTIPLYPVLLAADTTIKLVGATYRRIVALFGGGDEPLPVPERVERQAEKNPKN